MRRFYTTKQVATELFKIKIGTLTRAVFEERVQRPDVLLGSKVLVWDVPSINAASWVLRRRDASDIFPKLNKQLKTYSIVGA